MARRGRRRGCGGCGLVLLLVLLLVLAWVVLVPLGLLQRLGLRESAAETLLAGTPDREAAGLLLERMAAAGLNTQGVRLYVLPLADTGETAAFVLVDASQGFRFGQLGEDNAVLGYLGELALSSAEELEIDRLALQYIDSDGAPLLTVTAPTNALQAYARGRLDSEGLLEQLNVDFDIQRVLGEDWQ